MKPDFEGTIKVVGKYRYANWTENFTPPTEVYPEESEMELNLNMLFNNLINFKIKFGEDTTPTLIQVSNKNLVFILEKNVLHFKNIELNEEEDRIEIILE